MTDSIAMTASSLPVTAGQRFFEKFQRAYAVFAMMVYQGAFSASLRYLRGGDNLLPGDTDIVSTTFQAIILTILCWMWWLRRRYLLPVMRDIFPYLLILLLCTLSTVWSDYQFPTLRRSVTLTSCVFFGAYCYLQFGLKGTLELMGRAAVIVAILSIIVYFALPAVGHETAQGYEGAMRGVFPQKNTLGETMLLAISCYIYQLIDHPKSVVRPLLCMALLFFCMFMANSATSILISFIVLAVGAMFWSEANWRRRLVVLYALVVGFALIGAVVFLDAAQVMAHFNRDPSFTGRLPLWDASLQAAMLRPWLGYGYSGFWNQDSVIVQSIWAALDWQAPSAHNGYIDILLQIGIIGLLLYVWVWGSLITFAFIAWRERSLPEARWILLFMLINMLLNLDEGPLPYPDQFTVLMPGAILLICNWRRQRAFARAAARRRPVMRAGYATARGLPQRGS
jgi:exopolysaccharide production protein ExoQ